MVLATVLGGLIGIEREWSNHAAGFRTHILVCLGSTTIMMLSIYGFGQFVNETNVRIDPARIAAQVVNGIGFLGAGAIIRNGNVIKGLTTAASVWVVAAIGLCVGAGFLTDAIVCTLLVLVSLFLLNKLDKGMLKKGRQHEVGMRVVDEPGALGAIASKFGEHDVQIVNLKMTADEGADARQEGTTMCLQFKLKAANAGKWVQAMEEIASMRIVLSLEAPGLPAVKVGEDHGKRVSLSNHG
jgi:putative Mg2+ transporter-C (MgtC) family protein